MSQAVYIKQPGISDQKIRGFAKKDRHALESREFAKKLNDVPFCTENNVQIFLDMRKKTENRS